MLNLALFALFTIFLSFFLQGMNRRLDIPTKKRADICTIMYTSGTTGDPKGVMLSNESILSIISGVNHHLETINEEFSQSDVYLSYLPLAHIFDRVIEELFISKGASIGFWHKVIHIKHCYTVFHDIHHQSDNKLTIFHQDVKELLDDIKELKPTVFCSVPRVLDRIYSGM